jgi:hypothetical protein
MIQELVNQNYRASKLAAQYFNELVNILNQAIGEFVETQKLLESRQDFCCAVSFERAAQQKDKRGSNPTEYRSSVATLRL